MTTEAAILSCAEDSVARKRNDLKPGASLPLSMRIEPELAERIDELVNSLVQLTGLKTVNRTDVVRMLLKEALDARDARSKHKKS